MNPIETQMKFAREMMELNAEWTRKISDFDAESFKNYVDLNQQFAGRLSELSDVAGFVELQREYGESVWSNTQEVFKARAELVQGALTANSELVQAAFTPATEETAKEETAKKAPAPKRKAA